MSFLYENQGTNKYLVYRLEENDKIDSLSLYMLTNNSIAGLVPPIFNQIDTDRTVKYNISAKISLRQFLEESVNKKQVLELLRGIVVSLIALDEYMLEESNALLKEEYIYLEPSDCKIYMVYLPLECAIEGNESVEAFFKRIVFNARYDEKDASDYIAELIAYLNRKQGFLLSEFKELIEKLINNNSQSYLSIQTANNKAIVTDLPVSGETVSYEDVDTVSFMVNDNNQDIYCCANDLYVMTQPEEQITLMYLITHYSKENRLKFARQRRKTQEVCLKNENMISQEKLEYMMENRLLTTIGGRIGLLKRNC